VHWAMTGPPTTRGLLDNRAPTRLMSGERGGQSDSRYRADLRFWHVRVGAGGGRHLVTPVSTGRAVCSSSRTPENIRTSLLPSVPRLQVVAASGAVWEIAAGADEPRTRQVEGPRGAACRYHVAGFWSMRGEATAAALPRFGRASFIHPIGYLVLVIGRGAGQRGLTCPISGKYLPCAASSHPGSDRPQLLASCWPRRTGAHPRIRRIPDKPVGKTALQ
jgi:hypothetical protein